MKPLLERALQPQAGDKYIRADGRMIVEVTGVADNRISIECVDDGRCENRVWPLSTFQMLAQKSIEFGARFEANRSNDELKNAGSRTPDVRES